MKKTVIFVSGTSLLKTNITKLTQKSVIINPSFHIFNNMLSYLTAISDMTPEKVNMNKHARANFVSFFSAVFIRFLPAWKKKVSHIYQIVTSSSPTCLIEIFHVGNFMKNFAQFQF